MLTCGICHDPPVLPIRYDFQQAQPIAAVLKEWCYSTECRHTFCDSCLFEWWESSRRVTCPTCRTACRDTPVQHRLNNLISLASSSSDEDVEQPDTARFAVLMEDIWVNGGAKELGAPIVMDYMVLEDVGTSENPLDLTGPWN